MHGRLHLTQNYHRRRILGISRRREKYIIQEEKMVSCCLRTQRCTSDYKIQMSHTSTGRNHRKGHCILQETGAWQSPEIIIIYRWRPIICAVGTTESRPNHTRERRQLSLGKNYCMCTCAGEPPENRYAKNKTSGQKTLRTRISAGKKAPRASGTLINRLDSFWLLKTNKQKKNRPNNQYLM